MVGKLQYSSTGASGTYVNVGTIRLMRGKDYKVEAFTGKNREDDVEILGYKIKCQVTVQNLPYAFLNNNSYYFRIIFHEASQVIGTDELNYLCMNNHVGTSDNRPISGWDWEGFWELGGSKGVTWKDGFNYLAAHEIILGSRKYTHGYNALMQIHNIVHHIIGIEFSCNRAQVENYLLLT